jgi:integrase
VDRSIPERPAPMAARPKFKKIRFQMIGNISESRCNTGRPISKWTWSKVVEGISDRSGVAEFNTHTTRHLCLTDLARANWDVQEIATFAGHRSIQTTLLYIHLSGRELASKLAKGMAEIHAWRTQMLKEALSE